MEPGTAPAVGELDESDIADTVDAIDEVDDAGDKGFRLLKWLADGESIFPASFRTLLLSLVRDLVLFPALNSFATLDKVFLRDTPLEAVTGAY